MDAKRFDVARDYIEEAREHGKSDDEIRAALRRAGWEDGELGEVFAALPGAPGRLAAAQAHDGRGRVEGQRSMASATVVVAWLWLVVGGLTGLLCLASAASMPWARGESEVLPVLFALLIAPACLVVFVAGLGLIRRRAWAWWLLLVIALLMSLAMVTAVLADWGSESWIALSVAVLPIGTAIILLRDHPRHWSAPSRGLRPEAGGRLAAATHGLKGATSVAAWVWVGLPVTAFVVVLLAVDGNPFSWGVLVAWAPPPLLGAIGLLNRQAWGWWLLLVMAAASGALCGFLAASDLASSQNPNLALDAPLLLISVVAAATVVILLRDRPRNWVERG